MCQSRVRILDRRGRRFRKDLALIPEWCGRIFRKHLVADSGATRAHIPPHSGMSFSGSILEAVSRATSAGRALEQPSQV